MVDMVVSMMNLALLFQTEERCLYDQQKMDWLEAQQSEELGNDI